MENQGYRRPQYSLFSPADPGDRLDTGSNYSRKFDEDFPEPPKDQEPNTRLGCIILLVGSAIIWGLVYWFVIR